MYLTERSSPFEPGARPSYSSEARISMCFSRSAAVMASSAAFGGRSGAARAVVVRRIRKRCFINRVFVGGVLGAREGAPNSRGAAVCRLWVSPRRGGLLEADVLVRMMIQECWIPSLHTGMNEEGVRVMKERNDGGILEQNCFRFLEGGETCRQLGGLSSFADEPVIFGIAPAGIIISATGRPKIEE